MEDDSIVLEEALSFIADCEAPFEWLFEEDEEMLDLGLDNCSDNFGEELELPKLTELSIPECRGNSSQQNATLRRMSSEDLTIVPSSLDSKLCSLRRSPASFYDSTLRQLQYVQGKNSKHVKCKKSKQPRKFSNRARDAQREELVYLRQKVRDLQLQLDQLRDTRKPLTASAPFSSVAAPPSTTEMKDDRVKTKLAAMCASKLLAGVSFATFSSVAAPVASSAHLDAVWRDIAEQQALERQKAERESVRLKLALEKQIKMAKSLERLFKKRQNDNE